MRKKAWRVATPATLVTLAAPAMPTARSETDLRRAPRPVAPREGLRPAEAASDRRAVTVRLQGVGLLTGAGSAPAVTLTFFCSAYEQQLQGEAHP
jgi:hypothetical protein